jgi:hypothetical protein
MELRKAVSTGGDETCLRLEPGDVGRLIRFPKLINEGARASRLRIAVDQDQGCIHHTIGRVDRPRTGIASLHPSYCCKEPTNYSAATSSSVGHFFISTRCSNLS